MISWNKTYMNIAKEFAKHSKCSAKQVACILVKDNNIVGIGINGTISGKPNCNDIFKKQNNKWYKQVKQVDSEDKVLLNINNNEHHNWSLVNEVHAEINAIAKANKNGVSLEGAKAYITHSPCFNCSKTLAVFGISEIYYEEEYDDFETVKEFLLSNNIKIEQI